MGAVPTYALWAVGAIPACGPVVEAFGLQILAADDTIDRAGLGDRVMLDAAILRRLEAAVQPATIAGVVRSTLAALQPVVAVETIPLIEAGMDRVYDALSVVSAVPIYGYRIVNAYPHDPEAFTQGLVFQDGIFYEGTGLRGESTLRKVDLESGEVLQLYSLPPQYFGEGITIFGERAIQLTWQSGTGFVYDKESFEWLETFSYATEGWGITHDGMRLIMSDGTATLYFWDPETFEETGRVQVYDDNGPVVRLNELEYIQGQVYANIWLTDFVAIIDPQSGGVIAYIDLGGLLAPEDRARQVDVLNGIAYDAAGDRLFVTGKLWPKLFEIELVPPPGRVLLPLVGR
jgi:glutamine cyclotransferase